MQGGGSGVLEPGLSIQGLSLGFQGAGVRSTKDCSQKLWSNVLEFGGSMGTQTRGLQIWDAGVLGTRTGNSQKLLLEIWGPGCVGKDLSHWTWRSEDQGWGLWAWGWSGFPHAEDWGESRVLRAKNWGLSA